jgi:hypothetical protein
LVPSRYALRVGEIDVMVVSDGVLSLPGVMLGHNIDPAVRAAWLKDMFPGLTATGDAEHQSKMNDHKFVHGYAEYGIDTARMSPTACLGGCR